MQILDTLFWAQVDGLNLERYVKVIEIYGNLKIAREKISENELVQGGMPLKSAKSIYR